ncbi:MAG TPA: hypothetical protein PLV22_05850 [Candidatus Cloacimonadota bacterium]|nr:hypothetical protein [Candidatus Cloacimonadota bacterium]HOQ79710.1 hypothetical protein [Candidatus Cloacimonadota bacterium]
MKDLQEKYDESQPDQTTRNDNLHPLFKNILKGIIPIPNKDVTNNKSKEKEKKLDKKTK